MMLWLLLFALAVLGVAAAFFACYLADELTRSKRHRVQGTPADLGLRYDEVQFLTADRLTLRGWFLESPGARATIVLVHDLEATRADPTRRLLQLQRDYVRRGLSVFAFDIRGHGESAGRRDSLGLNERLDVLAAVAYVRRRVGDAQPVLLHGFGFGAALAITAAARSTEVTAVIADSAFLTMREYIHLRWRHLPGPVLALVLLFARRVYRADADALRPVKAIAQVTVPILLIHNEGDELVPLAHSLNLAAASLDGRDQVWVVADCGGHGTGYRQLPDAYLRRCLEFL
ncbi:MAG: alpha/beta fold hydrolase, partial [Dehalococcoidia bacterium]|nr:alpha/beta fold hydrolase [Dehalococcoidia bacterium]